MHALCVRPPVRAVLLRTAGMVQTRAAAPGRAGAGRAASGAASPPPPHASPSAAPASALAWDGVHNLRDLAEVDARLAPGRVFRAAAPVGASAADVRRLYDELGVRELIDLRSSDELRTEAEAADGAVAPAFEGAGFCSYRRDPVTRRSLPDPAATSVGDSGVMRVHIAPLEK